MTTARASLNVADVGTVYVDAAYLARLEGAARTLSFLPRQKRRSILSGQHGSRLRGRGLNFEEIRHYLPGDDIRTIDWKVTLRTGEPHLRAYTEERDRPTLLVVDQRMSMFFGSRRTLKSVMAAEVAGLGAWISFQAGDRVGAVVFDDQQIESIRPHRSRNRVHQIFGLVARFNQALRADRPVASPAVTLNGALEQVLRLAMHDCLVCIISDFAGADERTLKLLRAIAAHNDCLGALVFDPLSQQLVPGGRMVVSQGELQVELDLGASSVRKPLADFFSARLRSVAEILRRSAIPMLAFTTAESTREQLSRQLGNITPVTATGG